MKAGLEHLASSTIYEQIENDPTKPLSVAINTLIQQAHRKGWLSDYMRNYLRLDVSHVIVQQAYFLKKLHKDLIAVRPIVSGVGGPTEAISSFLDYYMQPHVLQIKSYVRDSASLIRLLEETQFPPEISLVTIDVKALYLTMKVCRHALTDCTGTIQILTPRHSCSETHGNCTQAQLF